MNSHLIKILLIGCLVFQSGCNLKLKRKVLSEAENKVTISEADYVSSGKEKVKVKEIVKTGIFFSKKDVDLINLYYSDMSNAIIRKDMIKQSAISEKQRKLLITGNILPNDIQVVPLPLKLSQRLSALPLNVLRVQVATHIILMNVKSRKILDIITI